MDTSIHSTLRANAYSSEPQKAEGAKLSIAENFTPSRVCSNPKSLSEYSLSTLSAFDIKQTIISEEFKTRVLDALVKCGFRIIESSCNEIIFDTSARVGKNEAYIDLTANDENEVLEAAFSYAKLKIPSGNLFPVVRSSAEHIFSITWFTSCILNQYFSYNQHKACLPMCTTTFSDEREDSEKLMDISMFQAAIGRKGDIDYMSTGGIGPCHAIVVWDKKNNTACLCHHLIDYVTEEGLENQVDLLLKIGSKKEDLEVKIIGGSTIRMGWRSGFFYCIEPAMRKLNIPITEVYLGCHKDRPSRILFDLQGGRIYSQNINRDTILHSISAREACKTRKSVKLSTHNYTVFDSSDKSIRTPIKFSIITT